MAPAVQGGHHLLMTRRLITCVAGVVTALLLLAAVWVIRDVRRTWARLDAAAQMFEIPQGFVEVGRARQGTAFCFVSCTNGGEAAVTVVMRTGALPVEDACEALGAAVRDVGRDTRRGAAHEDYRCSWEADLGATATVWAVVVERSALKPLGPAGLYGPRWTEDLAIPDAPVLAWVEFNRGIE